MSTSQEELYATAQWLEEMDSHVMTSTDPFTGEASTPILKVEGEVIEPSEETKVVPFKKAEKTTTVTTTKKTTYSEGYDYSKYNFGGTYNKYVPKVPKIHTYTGNLNKTEFPDFVNICKLSQKKLKQYLCGQMKEIYGENCIVGDGYIYCHGGIPVLLTAHMDTVHNNLIRDFYEDIQTDKNGNVTHKIASPQGIGGDDRCGIYIIMEILKRGYLPDVLFCEDEEIGCIGAGKFCKTDWIDEVGKTDKFIVELDRAHKDDLVFYSNANQDWINWVIKETGWKKNWGSCSDICTLSPMSGISSVNLSCGYYEAHTLDEYVIVEEMLETINIVEHLLIESENVEAFEYESGYSRYSSYGYYGYDGYDDDDEYLALWNGNRNSYGRTYTHYKSFDDYYNDKYLNKNTEATYYKLEIIYKDYIDDKEKDVVMEGITEADCWVEFFKSYPDICYNDVLDYYAVPYY